jgi:hypothetical protein
MGWAWKLTYPAIQIYFKVLWKHRCRKKYHMIHDHFMDRLYEFIFYKPTPCMADKELIVIRRIGYRYLKDQETYIGIYGATKARHFLPTFVPNMLVLQELAYQNIINRVEALLY